MKKIIADKNYFRIMPILLFLAAFFLLGSNKAFAQLSAGPSIYLEPATQNITVGETFSLVAKINPGDNAEIQGVNLILDYDESLISLDSITRPSTPVFDLYFGLTAPNPADGTADVTAAFSSASFLPINTATEVVLFNFTANSVGSADVIFGEGSYASSNGLSVAVSAAGSAVTVGAVPHETYNSTDVSHLISNWLQTIAGGSAVGDVNLDGKVDSRDLGIMMSYWQN